MEGVPPAPRRRGRDAGHAVVPPLGGGESVVDLHTHTLRTDGVLEPRELIAAAHAVGVRTLAITDHDSVAAYRELVDDAAIPVGLDLVAGVEINALSRGIPLADGELHVLGFGVDPDHEPFETALATQRAARRVRFERTVARLREIGLAIDDHVAHIDLTRDDALGRPTIARALIAGGHATSVEDAFRRLLGWGGPAYIQREGMGPRDAIETIRDAGGVPVLAHFAESPEQVPLLRELQRIGLAGLEVFHLSFTPDVVEAVGAVASELRFIATGGSDIHGDTSSYADAHATLHLPESVVGPLREAMEAAARTMSRR
jgi:predicted metal-dependent phosphoesterase TrpH